MLKNFLELMSSEFLERVALKDAGICLQEVVLSHGVVGGPQAPVVSCVRVFTGTAIVVGKVLLHLIGSR